MIKITDIKTFVTCPDDINLIVVRVETNQQGLFGIGCATYTQRCLSVVTNIEKYLKPLLLGRDPRNTQDLWNLCNVNGYWRNGPVVNSAMGGIDMALWDIKGKLAGMPVYQLLGGKSREGVAVYRYAAGKCKEEVLEEAQALWEQGYHYIRCQILPEFCSPDNTIWKTENPKPGLYCDPKSYMRKNVEMFEYIRAKMGFEPELLHDSHERLLPIDAIRFAKDLEPIRLFFLEDLFSPEQGAYLRQLRTQCMTPIAQGELFTDPNDWMYLVTERLIDFIRIHPSMIGGITPSIKCAHICEAFGVRLAWHGPIDMNPVGHAAQLHLDICNQNSGVMEWAGMGGGLYEVFTGIPELRNGYAYANDKPGFGVEFNEEIAAKYPHKEEIWEWTQYRYPDSTHQWP
jgi:mannonate dehydratase